MPVVLLALAAQSPSVAVFPLAGDAPAGAKVVVEDGLRAAIAARIGLVVQPAAQTKQGVAAARGLGVSCSDPEPACLARTGAVAGVELVVAGELFADGRLSLVAVDVATKAQRASVAPSRVDVASTSKDVARAAVRLLVPERDTGRLVVRVRPADAAVFVDGAPLGGASPYAVRAGPHDVAATRSGHVATTTRVEVPFDDTVEVAFDLSVDAAGAGQPGAASSTGARSGAASGPGTPASSSGVASRRLTAFVLKFKSAADDAELALAAADVVADALAGTPGVDVRTTGDLERMFELEASRQLAGCDTDSGSCLAELADALGADVVAYGSIAKAGTTRVVMVTLFDARTSAPIGRRTLEVASPSDLPAALRRATREIAAPLADDATVSGAFPWVAVGGGTALGVGALGAAAGALGVAYVELASDLALATSSREQKEGARWLGVAAIVGAAVGVAFAIGGGAALAVGLAGEGP